MIFVRAKKRMKLVCPSKRGGRPSHMAFTWKTSFVFSKANVWLFENCVSKRNEMRMSMARRANLCKFVCDIFRVQPTKKLSTSCFRKSNSDENSKRGCRGWLVGR